MSKIERINNKSYLLALNRISSFGPRTVLKCLSIWPKLEEMFGLSIVQLQNAGLALRLAQKIHEFDFKQIEDDLLWEGMPEHTLLTIDSPDYPPDLKEIHDPPALLYAIGDINILKAPMLAIVGSRKPSITGCETAWRFAHELAVAGLTIVSGLAIGIDAKAHDGCIQAGGKTIAVMGTGIDCIYPRENIKLAEKICQTGLLLSEFPLHSKPIAAHFPRRNRVISGLVSAILVVEAGMRSGSLITARLGLEQNRNILAIPGSILNPQAKGCHYLLQQGAKLVACVSDVMDEFGLNYKENSPKDTTTALAIEDKNLVKCIGFEITTIEKIIGRSEMAVEDVICGLGRLELQGIIAKVFGGYVRCSL